MSDIAAVNTAHTERQGLTCTNCGATYTSPAAAAWCCDTDDERGRE